MPQKRKRDEETKATQPKAPARHPFLAGLTIVIPPPPDIKLLFQALEKKDKNIIFRGKLSSEEVDQLVEAFKKIEPGEVKTLNLENVFSLATVDRTQDLEKIWEAVKGKITEFKLGHNNLPEKFITKMNGDIEQDKLPIQVDLQFCEIIRGVSKKSK